MNAFQMLISKFTHMLYNYRFEVIMEKLILKKLTRWLYYLFTIAQTGTQIKIPSNVTRTLQG